jgi:hypothetical protein
MSEQQIWSHLVILCLLTLGPAQQPVGCLDCSQSPPLAQQVYSYSLLSQQTVDAYQLESISSGIDELTCSCLEQLVQSLLSVEADGALGSSGEIDDASRTAMHCLATV